MTKATQFNDLKYNLIELIATVLLSLENQTEQNQVYLYKLHIILHYLKRM